MEYNNGIAIDPWLLARDRYLEDLSDDEKALFENATIENIFYSASAAQKRHEADSKTRLAVRKLKPFIAALEQYGKALDIYANASSSIMCPLWGSIRVVLQVCPSSMLSILHLTSPVVKAFTDLMHDEIACRGYREIFWQSGGHVFADRRCPSTIPSVRTIISEPPTPIASHVCRIPRCCQVLRGGKGYFPTGNEASRLAGYHLIHSKARIMLTLQVSVLLGRAFGKHLTQDLTNRWSNFESTKRT